jgi:hypothetical protein
LFAHVAVCLSRIGSNFSTDQHAIRFSIACTCNKWSRPHCSRAFCRLFDIPGDGRFGLSIHSAQSSRARPVKSPSQTQSTCPFSRERLMGDDRHRRAVSVSHLTRYLNARDRTCITTWGSSMDNVRGSASGSDHERRERRIDTINDGTW